MTEDTRPKTLVRSLISQATNPTSPQARLSALRQLLELFSQTAIEVCDLLDYGLPSDLLHKQVRNSIGLVSLRSIRRLVEIIAKPIEEEDERRLAESPVKWHEVRRDEIYHGIMSPALALFSKVRDRKQSEYSLLELRSGNTIRGVEAKAIRSLKPLPTGRSKWAELILRMTLSGHYWARKSDLLEGSPLHAKFAELAVRNRRNKAIRAFRKRYAVYSKLKSKLRPLSPEEFLELSAQDALCVVDRSKRSSMEPLASATATRLSARARDIVGMRPTQSEIRRELHRIILDRLKTIPR